MVQSLRSRQKDFDGIFTRIIFLNTNCTFLINFSFAKDDLQLFFCQSKKEKLQKKVAFLGFVEVIPLRKCLKTAESVLKRGNALRLNDLAS